MQMDAPDPMTADPNIGAGVGNMANDPNAGMPTEDPDMMGGEEMEDAPGDDDSTATIIDQLSDEDKEAVRNYAKSLLDRDEMQGNTPAPEEDTAAMPDQSNGGVMMEITKGRLKKVQQKLGETFRDNKKEEDNDRKQKKINKSTGKKSPFDSPLD